MYCFTINFQTIEFNRNIIPKNEKIIINVITFPGHEKQSIIINQKDMSQNNNYINLKTREHFNKLIFIFEKKNIFQFNPMIASRAIDVTNLPILSADSKNIEQKTFDIYKPILSPNDALNLSSRVVGKMSLLCFLSYQYHLINKNSPFNISKIHKGEGYSVIDENNKNGNKLMLLDEEYIN